MILKFENLITINVQVNVIKCCYISAVLPERVTADLRRSGLTSTPTKLNLNRHAKLSAATMPYECQFCDETFSVLSGLRTHKQRAHCSGTALNRQLVQSYVCHVCGESCGTTYRLRDHMKTHASVKVGKLSGKSSGQSTPITTNSLAHEQSHSNDKPYACNMCGVLFANVGNLVRHVKSKVCSKSQRN